MDATGPLKLTGCSPFVSFFPLLFNRNLMNNTLDCSKCDLEEFKVFLNNQAQLGNAEAICSGTNTYVVDHDFQYCDTGKLNTIRLSRK
jgi:site-specific recombinase XerD